ncbi:hypothetical protein [Paraburkholderia sp. MM6662-R1]|uniref:hypothetical protein n=1 Tax=Paraburkholderia sp. MM6662-R1 TaxID=2991066 RepID=UPI003D1930E6
MAQKERLVKPQYTERVIRFWGDAFNDYIAARVLILNGLLQQGAVLGSTAVEKYFKTMLATRGLEVHGHLQKAHRNSLRALDRGLFAQLNPDFLKLCQHCYLLRYSEQLPHGYNLVIASREFLAELDYTALLIEGRLVRKNENAHEPQSKLSQMVAASDTRLCQDNHVILGQVKEQFIYGAVQTVHELRRIANGVIVDVSYPSASIPDDRSFMRAAFVPKDGDDLSYNLSHLPVPGAQVG